MFVGSRGARQLALGVALVLAAAPVVAQQKIAVINAARVMSESKRGQVALAKIEEAQATKRAELEALNASLQALQREYTEGRLSLTEARLEALEEEITAKARNLEREQEDAQLALQKLSEKDLREIEQSILATIDAVGKELGYDLIFDMRQSGLVFASDSVDITSAVLQRFDASVADE